MSRALRFAPLIAIYLLVAHMMPAPEGVSPAGWRITGIFLATIAGLMLQPMPGAAVVIAGLTALVFVGGVPVARALSGFAAAPVWLVLTAMLLARAMRDTGLARRVALLFVRRFGGSALGVSYSLAFTDVTLAAGIPSITARSGGIVLPIARSIAEVYDSKPGPTAARLGTFLMAALYQGSAVAGAMFLTGQASNILAANLAVKVAGVTVTWSSWFAAAVVPGVTSAALVPYVVYRTLPPLLRQTPGATRYAREELVAMGAMSRQETITLATMVLLCAAWITSGSHGVDVTAVALAGIVVLLVSEVLAWSTVVADQPAWDVFIWYGGLLTFGEVLNETGATRVFAAWVGSWFAGVPWLTVLLVTLVVYFYAHYFFASITTHLVAMFPSFLAMLIGVGTPPQLAVYSLACLANLTAGLTHYGTTTAPMVYATGYLPVGDWWKSGFIVSIVNMLVWVTVGFAWWRWLGFW